MRSILFMCLMAVSTLVFTSSKSDALPVDFIDNGHYTTDTISGLDWLDVTETKGMSYNSVSSQLGDGGAYEGWRHATKSEFIQMMQNWMGDNFFPENTVTISDTLFNLTDLLGRTDSPDFGIGTGKFEIVTGYLKDVDAVDNTNLISDLWYGYLNNTSHYFTASGFDSSKVREYYGSYLIRETQLSTVPLPAAAWVFGAALGGLGWFTRRKRKTA